MKREEHFKRADKMEQDSELIYKQQLNYSMNMCKFSAIFAMGSMSCMGAYKLLLTDQIIEGYNVGELVAEAPDLYGFLAGFYAFAIVMYVCIARMPLRIYLHNGKYVAILTGMLPMSNLKQTFEKGDLVEDQKSILSWISAGYKLKGRHVILFEHRFRRPSDYYSLLSDSQSTKYVKRK